MTNARAPRASVYRPADNGRQGNDHVTYLEKNIWQMLGTMLYIAGQLTKNATKP